MRHVGSVGVVAWDASLGCYVSLYDERGGAFTDEEMARYVEAHRERSRLLFSQLPAWRHVTLAHACTDPGRTS